MKSRYQALLLMLGLNMLLLALLASQWWQGAVAGALIAAAVWIIVGGRDLMQRRLISEPLTQAQTIAPAQTGWAELLHGVVPAWRNNVQLARGQTQEAIDKLMLRFVGIHQRLGGALSLAEGGKNGDVAQVIQSAAVQLGNIATALDHVLSTRDILLHKIESLGQYNDDIARLTREMQRLAGHSDAADLFSSQERWPESAERVAALGEQILSKAHSAQLQIQMALVAANELDTEADCVIDDSRQVIDTVIADFRQSALKLSRTVDQLEEENREVDQEVCDILINLQFQDRISQILDHVQLDMAKLVGLTESAATAPLPETWLHELEQTYTTLEQRQIHAGQQADKSMQSQVDFF